MSAKTGSFRITLATMGFADNHLAFDAGWHSSEAILLWKRNVDKEFEGLEPCPICYSIVHPRNFSLPSIVCQTCNNKFHPDCLYKWFNTSHKNKCPLCQQAMNM